MAEPDGSLDWTFHRSLLRILRKRPSDRQGLFGWRALPGTMPRTARDVLNELRWREGDRLAEATIWYRDRRAATGVRLIAGAAIVDLERRYFTTASEGRMPYYKIERIERRGAVLFERPAP